jgi:hypothetical protein
MSFLVWLLAVLDISLSNECLFPFSWLDCIRWKRIFSCMASFLAIISQDTLRASINKYSTVIRVCGLRIGDPAFNELILDIPPHRLLQHTHIVILSHSIFKIYPSISINSLDLEIPNPKPPPQARPPQIYLTIQSHPSKAPRPPHRDPSSYSLQSQSVLEVRHSILRHDAQIHRPASRNRFRSPS